MKTVIGFLLAMAVIVGFSHVRATPATVAAAKQPIFYSIVQLDATTYVETAHDSMTLCQDHLVTLDTLGGHTMGCRTQSHFDRIPKCINTQKNVLSMSPVSVAFVYECVK